LLLGPGRSQTARAGGGKALSKGIFNGSGLAPVQMRAADKGGVGGTSDQIGP